MNLVGGPGERSAVHPRARTNTKIVLGKRKSVRQLAARNYVPVANLANKEARCNVLVEALTPNPE